MVLGLDFKIRYNINMNKKISKLFFLTIAFLMPVLSFAVTVTGDLSNSPGKIKNPISVNDLNGFIKAILEGAIKIGIPIIALAIIYSGFLFVKARGNPEAISKAKDTLLYTLIGAAILLGSWAIAQLVSNTILAL